MVDQVSAPQHFTTVMYTTKDGEHISATKNNGIVTLVGDKNGTRRMELEEFKNELINNCAEIKLEKTPEKDIVEIAGKTPAAENAKKAEEPKQAPAAATPATEPAKQEPAAETGKKLDVAA